MSFSNNDEIIEIDLNDPPMMTNPSDGGEMDVVGIPDKISCCKKFSQFLIGNHANYFGCVFCYGFIPGVMWFFLFLGLGIGFLAGMQNQTGVIVGSVCLGISVLGGALILYFAALYSILRV